MTKRITMEIIESYLNCKLKAQLKLTGQNGITIDYENLLAEARARVKCSASQQMSAKFPVADIERNVVVSQNSLKRGARLIFDGTVEDDQIFLTFDCLKRVNGFSKLGSFHYLPIIFDGTERPGNERRILLEALGLILRSIQGVTPGWGILVHGQEGKSRRVRLRSDPREAQQLLRDLRELQSSKSPRQLTLIRHCEVCEFRNRCETEAIAKDDISLIRSMSKSEIKRYTDRGIFTVMQLSCTFRPRKKHASSTHKRAARQHAVQALAIREKKTHIVGTPELPTSINRIYLDLEGDPDRNFVYLVGLAVEKNGIQKRHSFWANGYADQQAIFQQFIDVLDKNEPYSLYTYGSYEAAFVRRMSQCSGQLEYGEKVLARMVNVLSLIHSHFYFPTYSNGLKAIAGHLGFRWSESDASGIQSLVWRKRWEETKQDTYKKRLVQYNQEDCDALQRVTEVISALCTTGPLTPPILKGTEFPVQKLDDLLPTTSRREWCNANFAVPDFEAINDCARFDYQHDKVFIRSNPSLKRNKASTRKRPGRKWNLRPNHKFEVLAEQCPFCGRTKLAKTIDGRLVRYGYDLDVGSTGVRRKVIRFTTAWYYCKKCDKRFVPDDYLRLAEYFHSLKSWAMYEYVAHRKSFANVAESIRDFFRLPMVQTHNVFEFKRELACYYASTYDMMMKKLVGGQLLHADETNVHVRPMAKGYVWVFTNMEEVVMLYKPSREGNFLHELLSEFRGVLVTDSYSAYDSLNCPQQKCLVHLMRDFNQDIRCNPWDEELKMLASDFGALLRAIVSTIDRYGLKRYRLVKHQRAIRQFFCKVEKQQFRSETANAYRNRFLKNKGKLFTFVEFDNVPWNNNNAEHAVKHFAYYRENADGLITESGVKDYLVLLSVYLTCKYKRANFLRFLLSRETDIDEFISNSKRQKPSSIIELHPPHWVSARRSRRQTAMKHRIPKMGTSENGD